MADRTTQLGAILVATPDVLADLLQLPAGSHLDDVWAPHDQPGVLHLRIRGAGWPCGDGRLLTRTVGQIGYKVSGAAVIDWGLPAQVTPAAE